MNKISQFTHKEINLDMASKVKGGYFCDVYLGHTSVQRSGQVNSNKISKAMELDRILAEEGMQAALDEGGDQFLQQYG